MPEMMRVDSFLSLFFFILSNCKKRKFSSKLGLRLAALWESPRDGNMCVSIFLSVLAKCNFRLFIAFRVSRRRGMEIPKPARRPRHVCRCHKLAPARSRIVANCKLFFALCREEYYMARKKVIRLFFSREII